MPDDLPNLLTNEQRDEFLRASADLIAAYQRCAAAMAPAFQALASRMTSLYRAMQNAGVIDEHGRFTGGSQDDFALCPQPETADGDDHA
jgi:hypothetical protein